MGAPASGQVGAGLWGFGWAPILLVGLAVALVGAFSVIQLWRWLAWGRVFLDQMSVVLMIVFIVLWAEAYLVALGAVLVVAVVEVGPSVIAWRRPSLVVGRSERWRSLVFVSVAVVAVAVRFATKGAPHPFGVDWPRLSPLLAFVALLLVMDLVGLTRRGRAAARAALVVLVVLVIGVGCAVGAGVGSADWAYCALWLTWVLLAVTWLAQFPYVGWRWNGPAAVALIALTIIMGAFSGGLIRLVDLLDGGGSGFTLHATAIYQWLALGFVACVTAGVVGALGWFVLERQSTCTKDARDRWIGTYAGFEDEERRPIVRQVGLMRTLAATTDVADVVSTMIAVLALSGGIALSVLLWDAHGTAFAQWLDHGTPQEWQGLAQLASWLTLGLALGAYLLIRRGLRDRAARTQVGILWDVASFWPRSFHPFAPPAYASRAVPELQARLTEIAEGRPPQPGEAAAPTAAGTAVLSGHSQGSVLSLAALASLHPDVARRVWLVTHGSPLHRFYRRYFPRYFPESLLRHCCAKAGGGDSGGVGDGAKWLNFWRPTDPIGGRVCVDVGVEHGSPLRAALSEPLRSSVGRQVSLPDVQLYDPWERNPSPYEPAPDVRGHSGYLADPAMSGWIDALAAELSKTGP